MVSLNIKLTFMTLRRNAFKFERGHYEFQIIPSVVINVSRTFQRAMDNLLTQLQPETALPLQNNVTVFYHLRPHHMSQRTIQTLSKLNLKAKFGYFRRFILNFSMIFKLTQILHKDIPFNFDYQCLHSSRTLNQSLLADLILGYANIEEPFISTKDASSLVVGALFSHGPIGKDTTVTFVKRTVFFAEIKWFRTETEPVPIARAHFRHPIFEQKINNKTNYRL